MKKTLKDIVHDLLIEKLYDHLSTPDSKIVIGKLAKEIASESGSKASVTRVLIYRILDENSGKPSKKKSELIEKRLLGLLEIDLKEKCQKDFLKLLNNQAIEPRKRLRNAILHLLGWKSGMNYEHDSLWGQKLYCKNYESVVNAKFASMIELSKRLTAFFRNNDCLELFENKESQKVFFKNEDGSFDPAKMILLLLANLSISQRHLFSQKSTTEDDKKSFIRQILRQVESIAGLKPGILKLRKKSRFPKKASNYLMIKKHSFRRKKVNKT